MSAELVSITDAPELPARTQLLTQALCEAEDALYTALHQAELLENPYISPCAYLPSPMHRVLIRVWRARVAVQSSLEARIHKLERTLRATFASDALDDAQREAILSTLHGRTGARRNSKILSDTEASMISQYRTMDAAGKQMFRTLLARLADTSVDRETKGGA